MCLSSEIKVGFSPRISSHVFRCFDFVDRQVWSFACHHSCFACALKHPRQTATHEPQLLRDDQPILHLRRRGVSSTRVEARRRECSNSLPCTRPLFIPRRQHRHPPRLQTKTRLVLLELKHRNLGLRYTRDRHPSEELQSSVGPEYMAFMDSVHTMWLEYSCDGRMRGIIFSTASR